MGKDGKKYLTFMGIETFRDFSHVVVDKNGNPQSPEESKRIMKERYAYAKEHREEAEKKWNEKVAEYEKRIKNGEKDVGYISDGKVVLSPKATRELMRSDANAWRPELSQYSERLKLVKKLKELGYHPTALDSGFDVGSWLGNRSMIRDLHRMGVHMSKPISTKDYRNLWPRDMATQIKGKDGKLYLLGWGGPLEKLKEMGVAGEPIKTSLAEGGRVVHGNGIVLVHEGLLGRKEWGRVAQVVDKIYHLPSAELPIRYQSHPKVKLNIREAYVAHPHIDMVIGLAKGKDHGVMVVDPDYYKKNKELLRAIAKDSGHKIVKIARSEAHLMPANFINLPDGRILINHAPKLKRQLEKHGVGVEMMETPISANPSFVYGGPRCMTNIFAMERKKRRELK